MTMSKVIFIRETNDATTTKNGKLMQEFIVKVDDLTKGIYTLWGEPDDEVYPKGEYAVKSYDIDVRNNSGFTNLVMSNIVFQKLNNPTK